MNEMPDLPVESKIIEQRKVIKFWIDNCHYLEKLLEEQKKIITGLQKQVKILQDSSQEKPAPNDVVCVCCSGGAILIAKCGHYFCSQCVDRYHHKNFIKCEDHV